MGITCGPEPMDRACLTLALVSEESWASTRGMRGRPAQGAAPRGEVPAGRGVWGIGGKGVR